ncbi:ATP-grasp domain-containing protein [Rheinheimera sp. WS51]|uniref:ATP-grasp domain-containing protein n=1 Tax=Rheinheimera sp. WS51 TaxID=3425886 RepID=UPI003D9072B9
MKQSKYCLLLGVEKNRFRSIVAGARMTDMPIAIMQKEGFIDGNRYAEVVIEGNFDNPDEALKAVQQFAEKTGMLPGAVVPLSEMAIMVGAKIAAEYGLPYLSEGALNKARDKYEMRKVAQENGIKVPKFAKFSDRDQLQALSKEFSFPVVIKPANAGGSEGVAFVNTPEELDQAFDYLQGAVSGHKIKYGLKENDYQIEEFVKAEIELSVEVINSKSGREVLCVTDKELTPLPYFVEIGHSIPSVASDNQALKDAALRICDLMHIEHGLAHVEFFITAQGEPVLLEVNARTAGGGIPEVFEKVTGVNMFELHIGSYLYDSVEVPEINIKGLGAIGFMKAAPGVVEKINLPTSAELPESVIGIQLWAKEGKVVNPSFNNGELEGFVEFYWPEYQLDGKPKEYLTLTEQLTESIFELKAVC